MMKATSQLSRQASANYDLQAPLKSTTGAPLFHSQTKVSTTISASNGRSEDYTSPLKIKAKAQVSIQQIVSKIRRTATTKKVPADERRQLLREEDEEFEAQTHADEKLRLGVIQEEGTATSDCNTRYTSNAPPSISTALGSKLKKASKVSVLVSEGFQP